MRNFIYFLLLPLFALMASGCNDDEPKDKTEIITMWVSAETGVTYHWGDDQREYPIECMMGKFSAGGSWEPMTFNTIEGFAYEKGVEYELAVYRTTLSNPPADGSMYTYRLDRIISTRVVISNAHGLEPCIEVPAEGKVFDIDFTTNAPCEILYVTGDVFGEIDLLERSDSRYDHGYSLRLNIPENPGMGRVRCITLRFSNGDKKKVGIWQMPRKFGETETFELPASGCLGYMIGDDETNFGKIRNITIAGSLNANDCYYLQKILNAHKYQGYGGASVYTVDLSRSGFSHGDSSKYGDCGICNIDSEYLPAVSSNVVPDGVFSSNKYIARVILPENIECIGNSAFSHCISLTWINIPSSCKEIGSFAFQSCTSLENVEFPYISKEEALPQLQSIGQEAFMNIGRLNSFVLPASLEKVATSGLNFYVDKLFSLTEEPPVWEVPGNAGYVLGPKSEGCTLYVPYRCSKSYKASEKWTKFKIEEMPEENWWEMIP